MAVYVLTYILFEEDEVLQDDFLFFVEGFAVVVLQVVVIEDFLDADDEEIADVDPVASNLPCECDVLEQIFELIF